MRGIGFVPFVGALALAELDTFRDDSLLLRLEAESSHCPKCDQIVGPSSFGADINELLNVATAVPTHVRFTVFSDVATTANASLIVKHLAVSKQQPDALVVVVNGRRDEGYEVRLSPETVTAGNKWATVWTTLGLRSGLNTVEVAVGGVSDSKLGIDALEFHRLLGSTTSPTLSMTGGGATVAAFDFVEYEAEDAQVASCSGCVSKLRGPGCTRCRVFSDCSVPCS